MESKWVGSKEKPIIGNQRPETRYLEAYSINQSNGDPDEACCQSNSCYLSKSSKLSIKSQSSWLTSFKKSIKMIEKPKMNDN